jgi:hypothetical protein
MTGGACRLASRNPLVRVVLSGLAGLVVWELFARLAAPIWIGFALDPTALLEAAFGVTGAAGQAIHLALGLLVFPFGYIYLVGPRLIPGLPWPVAGLLYGVALWVGAMYGLASVLGGMPPFMGFEPVAWASLTGHLGLGLAIAATDASLPAESRG